MDMNMIVSRLMRVLRFDASVYREIAADGTAMPQAGIVVTLAAIIAALGQFTTWGIVGVIVIAVLSIIGFFIYAAVATFVAKTFFKGQTDFNEMGRTLGYAYVWYALGVLALIPGVGGLLAWLGSIVAAVAGFIALRESAEFDNVKALVTVIIAAVVAGLITAVVQVPALLMLGLGTAQ